ncbi:hypothetical protein BDV98DRAFT_576135 [Pterulicium gracile]|uniref:Uncharacterized protein n=1 Tax=Pterulicium gracile TaxID=1884261 RepID=A0A5C3Q5N7_9AGAR|nr:hypothetical protein BDV98DRAFT_576135 [Pterula gracilis]
MLTLPLSYLQVNSSVAICSSWTTRVGVRTGRRLDSFRYHSFCASRMNNTISSSTVLWASLTCCLPLLLLFLTLLVTLVFLLE